MNEQQREAVLKFATMLMVKHKIDVIDHAKQFVGEPNVMVSEPRAAGKQSIKVITEFKRVLADGMTMGLVKPWESLDSAALYSATVKYCEYLRFYRCDDDLKIVKHFYKYALKRMARGILMTEEKFDECLRDYVRGS